MIMDFAVEIINETFDGILGANPRGSFSYSAWRPIQRKEPELETRNVSTFSERR